VFYRLNLSLLFLALFCFTSMSIANSSAINFQVSLQNADRSKSIAIATIKAEPEKAAYRYQVSMNQKVFGDYFLAMRPFKCTTDDASMLCHLAYPYELDRSFSDSNFMALEYDFLFIKRKPTDYGIDPWHGLYYRIEKQGDEYVGVAHDVDLNMLAVPPEGTDFPIQYDEVHETELDPLWMPYLVIKPE